MNLYIRIKDGQPFEHPILEENLISVFPDIDLNNLPDNFAKFERVQKRGREIYEVYEGVTYVWEGNIVKDFHNFRPMTEQEKQSQIKQAKDNWIESGGFKSWIFNEELFQFEPPYPAPDDGIYTWQEPKGWVKQPATEIPGV
jgi:hypothetical protein